MSDFSDTAGRTMNRMSGVGRFMKFGMMAAIILFVALICVWAGSLLFTFQTDEGYNYHVQNTLFGTERIITKAGVHKKLPLYTTVTKYKQVFTIAYEPPVGTNKKGIQLFATKSATINRSPITALFADTYTADIPCTFRFRLPMGAEPMKRLHHDFRSFDNLAASLCEKTANDVVINTATQFTGEEFLLGAINQFKASVSDQMKLGVYVTERRQVEIDETSLASVGLDQEDSNKLQKTKKLVWKTVPLTHKDGTFRRQINPLDIYGISSTQFTMGRPIPEKQLQTLLTDKKDLVAKRIRAVQEQETAKEQAKTAQLLAEIERTKANQAALKTKELALIAMQQEVESERKQAEKEEVQQEKVKTLTLIKKQQELEVAAFDKKAAAVQKAKELDIATSNLAIEEAAFRAAQFRAKSIKEVGLAEAAVEKAKYAAYDKDIYVAELQRSVSEAMFRSLPEFKVQMPLIMNNGSGGGASTGIQSNLQLLTDIALLNKSAELSTIAE